MKLIRWPTLIVTWRLIEAVGAGRREDRLVQPDNRVRNPVVMASSAASEAKKSTDPRVLRKVQITLT